MQNSTVNDPKENVLSPISLIIDSNDQICPVLKMKYNDRNYAVSLHCGHKLSVHALTGIKKTSNKCPVCKVDLPDNYTPQRVELSASQEIKAVKEEKDKKIYCLYHPQEKANILCLEDFNPLCVECGVENINAHKDHKKISFKKLPVHIAKEKRDLEECIKYFEQDAQSLKEGILEQNHLDLLAALKQQKKIALDYISKRQNVDNSLYEEEMLTSVSNFEGNYTVKNSDFYRAVAACDIQKVRGLILNSKNREELVNSRCYYEAKNSGNQHNFRSSLYTAVMTKNLELVKLIVENGGDISNGREEQITGKLISESALNLAERLKYVEIGNYLQSKM